jgi:hypothetical protein
MLLRSALPGSSTGPRSIVLTLVGVLLPLGAIGAFTLYLAAVLLRLGASAL